MPGSVTIARAEGGLRDPLIYEGLHEICPLCGGDSHQLNICPKLPLSQKVEVLVEKFDATGVTVAQPSTGPNLPHLILRIIGLLSLLKRESKLCFMLGRAGLPL